MGGTGRLLRAILAGLALILSLAARAGTGGDATAWWLTVDGQPVAARHADQPQAPASLTKVMTALLVLEQGRLDQPVTISAAAARESGTRLGLRRNERYRARDLLAAVLIRSANDACVALAEHVAGNEVRFVERMNQRARALGLQQTRFANACGHDHPAQRSTARELAKLTETALQHQEFLRLTGTVRTEIRDQSLQRHFVLENTNQLVGRYPGAIGVKTGYTPGAGKCVIALAERRGRQALLVLLNAPDRWWQAESLLDQAFGLR